MGVVFSLAILADRRWDSFNSLIVAAFVILLLYPLSLFAVDFQLSFMAVAGILLVAPPLQRHMREAFSRDKEPVPGGRLWQACPFFPQIALWFGFGADDVPGRNSRRGPFGGAVFPFFSRVHAVREPAG